jgi:protein-arginine kinase
MEFKQNKISVLDFFKNLLQVERSLEKSFKFEHDEKLGYITTFPNNLGSTFEIEVIINCQNLYLNRPLSVVQELGKNYSN